MDEVLLRYVAAYPSLPDWLRLLPSVAGCLAAIAYPRARSRLPRVGYFACSMLIVLLTIMLPFAVSRFGAAAFSWGIAWLVVLVSVALSVVLAYAFTRVALSRSREAFGHDAGAILGFIPFLALILLFKRRKETVTAPMAPYMNDLFEGSWGVIVGMMALAASVYLQGQIG